MEPEQKRSGTCGACETIRVAKLARAKVVGGEAGEEVGKVELLEGVLKDEGDRDGVVK